VRSVNVDIIKIWLTVHSSYIYIVQHGERFLVCSTYADDERNIGYPDNEEGIDSLYTVIHQEVSINTCIPK
jgi:hypothetical protein